MICSLEVQLKNPVRSRTGGKDSREGGVDLMGLEREESGPAALPTPGLGGL